jgi:hypothetical protein
VARVEQRQLAFGRAFEQVGRLLLAVDTNTDPDIPLRVLWRPADTKSEAQLADASVKLFQAGLLSREETLRRLGLTDDQIAAELERINRDVSDARDLAMGRYMAGQTDR